jgi:hypothetical protein
MSLEKRKEKEHEVMEFLNETNHPGRYFYFGELGTLHIQWRKHQWWTHWIDIYDLKYLKEKQHNRDAIPDKFVRREFEKHLRKEP